jgi:hypothetical protein
MAFTAGRAGQQQDLVGTEGSVNVKSSSGGTSSGCGYRLNIFRPFLGNGERPGRSPFPLRFKHSLFEG